MPEKMEVILLRLHAELKAQKKFTVMLRTHHGKGGRGRGETVQA